nr:hypothetical protein [Morchella crassipes]
MQGGGGGAGGGARSHPAASQLMEQSSHPAASQLMAMGGPQEPSHLWWEGGRTHGPHGGQGGSGGGDLLFMAGGEELGVGAGFFGDFFCIYIQTWSHAAPLIFTVRFPRGPEEHPPPSLPARVVSFNYTPVCCNTTSCRWQNRASEAPLPALVCMHNFGPRGACRPIFRLKKIYHPPPPPPRPLLCFTKFRGPSVVELRPGYLRLRFSLGPECALGIRLVIWSLESKRLIIIYLHFSQLLQTPPWTYIYPHSLTLLNRSHQNWVRPNVVSKFRLHFLRQR